MPTALRSTRNYDLFELHNFNREVKRTEFLEQSMRRYGWIDAYPMHVSRNGSRKKLKIKGGHHRFVVAKKLGIPVKYVICKDEVSIYELERATIQWKPADYLYSYVQQGRDAYIAVKEYVQETGIPLMCAVSLLAGESAGSSNKMKAFKDGRYRLGNPFHAKLVKDVVLHMRDHGIDFANCSTFVQALSKALWIEEFNVDRFKRKVEKHGYTMKRRSMIRDCLNEIEDLYNRASRDRLSIVFLAYEVAKARQQTFGRPHRDGQLPFKGGS
jgi:hypothetical protein